MDRVTVTAKDSSQAAKKCREEYGFTPDAVRQVDSGGREKAWMCFESARDAEIWDRQK